MRLRKPNRAPGNKGQNGAALVEFALMSLALYLLIAGGIELGRMIFVSQVLQDAARLAARELAVTPLPAGDVFDDPQGVSNPATCGTATNPPCVALENPTVIANVWDARRLVIDTSCFADAQTLDNYLNSLPLVNRALRPLFITDTITIPQIGVRRVMRYPGILSTGPGPTPDCGDDPVLGPSHNLTVTIPMVLQRGANGVETSLRCVPVMSEVRSNPDDPASGPFSFTAPTTSPGIAAVALNYPFQAAALSGYQNSPPTPTDPMPPNMGGAILADDRPKATTSCPANMFDPQSDIATYAGVYGLGHQAAMPVNQTYQNNGVRPYRNLLLGQSLFRREVVCTPNPANPMTCL